MRHSAKLFMNGRSQAVRIPAEFRFDCDEVFIRKDPETGELILSKKAGDWDSFFKMLDGADIPDDFLSDEDRDVLPQERDLF